MNAAAAIGHNQPETAYDGFLAHIEDLFAEAKNFLDGEPITTEGQSKAVANLLNRLRRTGNDADEARKAEKKPHADAAKEVDARWKPPLDKIDLAVTTCKQALSPYLQAVETEQRRVAEAQQQEAERLAEAARQASPRADDLAGQAQARALQEQAADAQRRANTAAKVKTHAKGGERAIGLRTVWRAEIIDRREVLNHYARRRPEELTAWLQAQVDADVRASVRNVPGVTYHEERVAQ